MYYKQLFFRYALKCLKTSLMKNIYNPIYALILFYISVSHAAQQGESKLSPSFYIGAGLSYNFAIESEGIHVKAGVNVAQKFGLAMYYSSFSASRSVRETYIGPFLTYRLLDHHIFKLGPAVGVEVNYTKNYNSSNNQEYKASSFIIYPGITSEINIRFIKLYCDIPYNILLKEPRINVGIAFNIPDFSKNAEKKQSKYPMVTKPK